METRTAGTARWVRRAVIGVASAAVLAGCGGGTKLDEGHFSASDRQAARTVLGILSRTSVWQAAQRMTLTVSRSPVCVLHIESAKPLTFKLFMTWIPTAAQQRTVFEGAPRAYVWLQAIIGPQGLKRDYSLHLGNERSLKALKSHYGDAFTKPVERCVLLVNGTFGLRSSAD